MRTSLSDKIAVLLAWVLVHTAIGIIFIHVNTIINDPTIEILAYILNFYIHLPSSYILSQLLVLVFF